MHLWLKNIKAEFSVKSRTDDNDFITKQTSGNIAYLVDWAKKGVGGVLTGALSVIEASKLSRGNQG